MLREVKTSEVGDTISLHQIQNLPQASRNFLEFADTVPGMAFTDDGQGHTSLRGGAQNTSSTNVYIDGVGQKSYVKEGGVAGQNASAGNPFPQLAIGEYKVITSNYKAEYAQVSSAAVTAVTKSGTNEFHGEAFYRYSNNNLREETPAEAAAGDKGDQQPIKEFGAAFGGPIIKDKMHFFVTYEGKRFDTPAVVDGGVTGYGAYLPPDAQAQLGNTTMPFKEDLYFGKIDWEITDSDRIELSAQDREENQEDNVGGATAHSAGVETDNYDRRVDLRWEHSADRWFNELLFTHEDSFNNPLPLTYGNGSVYTVPNQQDTQELAIGGASPLSAQHKGQKGWSVQDNLTFNSFEWHGDHTIKMGVSYKDVDLTSADALNVNPQFYYNVTPDGTADTPWKAFFTKGVSGLGTLSPEVTTSDKQYGAYIQDDWAVNEHLTLNLGVRWDMEKNPAYLDFVTPQNVVDALNSQDPNAPDGQTYAQSLAAGGVNVDDYISNGHNRKAYADEWQPRLGFSYDIGGDEKHVIHGGAGRAYDRDLYDYLQLEVTKAALPQFTVYFQNPDTGLCQNGGAPCVAWDPNYLNGLQNLQALVAAGNGGEIDVLNNNLKVPYSDQFSLGMSNQFGAWLTDATITRVLSKDGFAFTLGNRYPDGGFWEGTPTAGQPWGNGVPGFGSLIIGNNGIETRNTQLLLSAEKPYTKESGWGATFAYTYTHAMQNRDINEHYSFDRETIGDYPFITSNAAPKHRLVATGTLDIPWGVTLGAKLTLATPTPWDDFQWNLPVDDPTTQPNFTPKAGTPKGGGSVFGLGHFGFRDLDLQATKDFHISNDFVVYGRLDLLNVFNDYNFTDVLLSNNYPDFDVSYNQTGNITYYTRTLKLEVGLRF